MNTKRIVTYSLLAHINNTGTLSKGLIEVFVPLAKRALAELNKKGIFKGKSIREIQKKIACLYGLEIPAPVLKNILYKISEEVNEESNVKFTLYQDGAFALQNYVFTEFDAIVAQKEKEVDDIEKLFREFCKTSEIAKEDYSSIFSFLEKNKIQISKYISETTNGNGKDYSIEAQFIEFFRNVPPVFEKLKDLYLGTIISSYIEYSSPQMKTPVELLFDTNFLVSLLDLNTEESTNSCRTLVSLAKQHGYKLTVLKDTIDETERLLRRRSEHFNAHYLTKKINPEDIYNACDRRNLTKTDLEHIADTLQETLVKEYGIYIIPHTDKYRNKAKFSKEFASLKEYRNNEAAALHDATALYYVRDKRNDEKIKSFDRVPCWFVNNAVNYVFHDASESERKYKNGHQPEIIKADVLLNILWLANPNQQCNANIAHTGLACLVSSSLIESMPKNSIIKELDDNINKYANEDLTPEQVVRVAKRIANKQVNDLDQLNSLAKDDKEAFVKRLQKEAEKQKQIEIKRNEQVNDILNEFEKETKRLSEQNNSAEVLNAENEALKTNVSDLSVKLKELQNKERIRENEIRQKKREELIDNHLKKWRRKSWIELVVCLIFLIAPLVVILWLSQWDIESAQLKFQEYQSNFIIGAGITLLSIIFNAVVIRTLFNKYRNHSNINAFKTTIPIPEELKE
ncbi:hypothetical protein [Carboxylicivirga linearis]|uniref:PIN like domain-containing protein n=1 Tax=Carboxylicivirga linearis TaxID=1628157 RepID=A0ABS5JY41_9BACT|nr:hypothetical protein [Carboxylicivirga linearis]MBS2099763.1 hypothetical protein [Carboxylicivirga linearis]